jgi:hypothetical protein
MAKEDTYGGAGNEHTYMPPKDDPYWRGEGAEAAVTPAAASTESSAQTYSNPESLLENNPVNPQELNSPYPDQPVNDQEYVSSEPASEAVNTYGSPVQRERNTPTPAQQQYRDEQRTTSSNTSYREEELVPSPGAEKTDRRSRTNERSSESRQTSKDRVSEKETNNSKEVYHYEERAVPYREEELVPSPGEAENNNRRANRRDRAAASRQAAEEAAQQQELTDLQKSMARERAERLRMQKELELQKVQKEKLARAYREQVKNGSSGPGRMDMRQKNAAKVQYSAAAMSKRMRRAINNLAMNPGGFMLSIATSVATFTAVKLAVVGVATLSGVAVAPIAAAMLASGLIGMWKATAEERRARQNYAAELQHAMNQGYEPGPNELAKAQNVNAAGIVAAGFKHALISGAIGSVISYFIEPMVSDWWADLENSADNPHATKEQYANFKNELIDHYPVEQDAYTRMEMDESGTIINHLGAYNFTVAELQQAGLLDEFGADDCSMDDLNSYWITNKNYPDIDSLDDFLKAEDKAMALQKQTYAAVLDSRLDAHWEEIQQRGWDTEYVGERVGNGEPFLNQEMPGEIVTPELMVGIAEIYGIGEGEEGLAGFLKGEEVVPKEKLNQMAQDFWWTEAPYEPGKDGRVEFYDPQEEARKAQAQRQSLLGNASAKDAVTNAVKGVTDAVDHVDSSKGNYLDDKLNKETYGRGLKEEALRGILEVEAKHLNIPDFNFDQTIVPDDTPDYLNGLGDLDLTSTTPDLMNGLDNIDFNAIAADQKTFKQLQAVSAMNDYGRAYVSTVGSGSYEISSDHPASHVMPHGQEGMYLNANGEMVRVTFFDQGDVKMLETAADQGDLDRVIKNKINTISSDRLFIDPVAVQEDTIAYDYMRRCLNTGESGKFYIVTMPDGDYSIYAKSFYGFDGIRQNNNALLPQYQSAAVYSFEADDLAKFQKYAEVGQLKQAVLMAAPPDTNIPVPPVPPPQELFPESNIKPHSAIDTGAVKATKLPPPY